MPRDRPRDPELRQRRQSEREWKLGARLSASRAKSCREPEKDGDDGRNRANEDTMRDLQAAVKIAEEQQKADAGARQKAERKARRDYKVKAEYDVCLSSEVESKSASK